MAEEHRCQAPRLCVNNCGFFGSPATQNLCSKCFRDLQLKEQQSSSAKQAFNQTMIASPSSSKSSSSSSSSSAPPGVDISELFKPTTDVVKEEKEPEVPAPVVVPAQTSVNRCMTCRKRVGLTGFKCRCGSVYCGSHRYPEQHQCTFDFKEMGKEQIAKANPVVKAQKLQKI